MKIFRFILLLIIFRAVVPASAAVVVEPLEIGKKFFWSDGTYEQFLNEKSNDKSSLKYLPGFSDVKTIIYRQIRKNDDLKFRYDGSKTDLFVKFILDSAFAYSSHSNGNIKPTTYIRYKVKLFTTVRFEDYLGNPVHQDSTILFTNEFRGTENDLYSKGEFFEGIYSPYAIITGVGFVNYLNKFDDRKVQALDVPPIAIEKGEKITDQDIINNSLIADGKDFAMTAMVLNKEGYFIADARVFKDKDTLVLVTSAKDTLHGTIVRKNKILSMCLGKIVEEDIEFSNIVAPGSDSAYIGKNLFAYATFARVLGQSYAEGNVVQVETKAGMKICRTNLFYQISCSGSGLFDQDYRTFGFAIVDNLDYRNNPFFVCYPVASVFDNLFLTSR